MALTVEKQKTNGPRYTYYKRLGWVNKDKFPCIKGKYIGFIFYFYTVNGKPVVFPDQWEETEGERVERVPEYVKDVHYMGAELNEKFPFPESLLVRGPAKVYVKEL